MANTTYAYNPSTKSYQAVKTPSKSQQKAEIASRNKSKSGGSSKSSNSSNQIGGIIGADPSTIAKLQAENKLIQGEVARQTSGYSSKQKTIFKKAQKQEELNALKEKKVIKTSQEVIDSKKIGGITDADPSTIAMLEANNKITNKEVEKLEERYSDLDKDKLKKAQERERLKTIKLYSQNKLTADRAKAYNAKIKKTNIDAKLSYEDALFNVAKQMKERDKQIAYNKLPVFGKEKIQYDPLNKYWTYKQDNKKAEIQPQFSSKEKYIVPSSRRLKEPIKVMKPLTITKSPSYTDRLKSYPGRVLNIVTDKYKEFSSDSGKYFSSITPSSVNEIVLKLPGTTEIPEEESWPKKIGRLGGGRTIFGQNVPKGGVGIETPSGYKIIYGEKEAEKTQRIITGTIESAYQQVREKPIETGALIALSYGIGTVASTLPVAASSTATVLGASTKVASTANILTKGTIALGGTALAGKAVYDVGSNVIAEPDWERKGRIIGSTGVQFAAMGIGFKGGIKQGNRIIGRVRTIGMQNIELEKLTPQEVLSGKTNFPAGGKTPEAELQLFKESPYRLPIERMARPDIYGRVGEQSLVFANEFGNLPFKVPSTGYHATGYQWFKPGENIIAAPGSSELPGRYISHAVSPHFTRVTSVSSKTNIFENLLKGLKTPSGKPVIISEQPELFRISGFKTTKPYELEGAIFTRVFKKSPKAGAADLPLMKLGGESEAVIRPGTGSYVISKSGFYTTIEGVRVPIVRSKYIPGTATLNTKPTIIPESTGVLFPSQSNIPAILPKSGIIKSSSLSTSVSSSLISKPITISTTSLSSMPKSSMVSSFVSSTISSPKSSMLSKSKSSRISSPKSSLVSSPMSSIVSSPKSSLVSSPMSSIVFSSRSSPRRSTLVTPSEKTMLFPNIKMDLKEKPVFLKPKMGLKYKYQASFDAILQGLFTQKLPKAGKVYSGQGTRKIIDPLGQKQQFFNQRFGLDFSKKFKGLFVPKLKF